MTWKKELMRLRAEDAKPPQGAQDIDAIAAEMDVGTEAAQKVLKRLVAEGRAERIAGKKMSASGALVPCTYYRLIGGK